MSIKDLSVVLFWVSFSIWNDYHSPNKVHHLEANAGFFRLLMKGIFDPYLL